LRPAARRMLSSLIDSGEPFDFKRSRTIICRETFAEN
jgi:hypothetical protein